MSIAWCRRPLNLARCFCGPQRDYRADTRYGRGSRSESRSASRALLRCSVSSYGVANHQATSARKADLQSMHSASLLGFRYSEFTVASRRRIWPYSPAGLLCLGGAVWRRKHQSFPGRPFGLSRSTGVCHPRTATRAFPAECGARNVVLHGSRPTLLTCFLT
jgi:hypothetical protein